MDVEAVDYTEGMTPEQREQRAIEERAARLGALGQRLQAEFDQRVNDRRHVENRWLEDLRQYNGQYDPQVLAQIKQNEGSEAFINITRTKTDAVEARIADYVLPTDDRNWDIKPTPMPELSELESNTRAIGTTAEGNPVTAGDMATAVREIAAKRAARMRDVMDDQLAEAGYNATIREIIHDACVLGIGILKGPVVRHRLRRSWRALKDATGSVYVADIIEDRRPHAVRVDPWHFYPQSGVVRIQDSESEFERHLLTRQQLRELAKQPGFDRDALRRALAASPHAPNVTLDWRIQLRAIAGDTASRDERYELIEYTGPIEAADLIAAGVPVRDDPLAEYHGNIWFMNGIVVKASLSVMGEHAEKAYKVFNYARDDSTIFGRGVPRQMRTSQALANSALRMMQDNAGLAVGGQLVYMPGYVVPADGNPRMTPRKTWHLTSEALGVVSDVKQVFGVAEIPLHLEWLQPLFLLALRLADEESQLPLIAQGDQASHITKTKGGMSILMDAANVMLRRSVKAFDDGITVPFITDLYTWNMLFSPDEEIKGDYTCVARGSSALMEREQQLQAFQLFVQFLNSHPVFQKVARWDQVLEEGARLLRVNRGSLLESPEKIAQAIRELQANPPQPPPDPRVLVAQINAEAEKQIEASRQALQKVLHDADVQVRMNEIATRAGLSYEQFVQSLGLDRMKLDSENQRFNTEMLAKMRMGSGI